ncbi:MAG TPA: OmpA family protein [Isosphaeraceae bacterium]|jgi:phospholipid/cholesterol/gamma-HCH transport system substrate-binding protein
MRREIGIGRALASAGLILAILALAGFGVVRVSARHWQWQETFRARAEFATISGLELGGQVRVQGIDAGAVEAIVPPPAPGRPVTLVLRLDARLRSLVRADASARIVAQGVVGAKVVEIAPGLPDAPPLPEGGVLRTEAPIEVADLLRDAAGALRRIDAVAEAAEKGLGEVNTIAEGIRRGEGSLGRLVRDDEAYRKLVALSDRGEKALGSLEENLTALKRTWPISRYFNDRSFFERDRVLFQPGSERDSRTLPEDALFEPGRAVLTARGRQELDKAASWIKKAVRAKTEVVIAAFTDEQKDAELADVLTQEQADAVRKYLIAQHRIDSVGWFGARRVAAVGFGTQIPRAAADPGAAAPPRRVEIILFTPQA